MASGRIVMRGVVFGEAGLNLFSVPERNAQQHAQPLSPNRN